MRREASDVICEETGSAVEQELADLGQTVCGQVLTKQVLEETGHCPSFGELLEMLRDAASSPADAELDSEE